LSLSDNGYSRNASSALHLKSTFLLWASERYEFNQFGFKTTNEHFSL